MDLLRQALERFDFLVGCERHLRRREVVQLDGGYRGHSHRDVGCPLGWRAEQEPEDRRLDRRHHQHQFECIVRLDAERNERSIGKGSDNTGSTSSRRPRFYHFSVVAT